MRYDAHDEEHRQHRDRSDPDESQKAGGGLFTVGLDSREHRQEHLTQCGVERHLGKKRTVVGDTEETEYFGPNRFSYKKERSVTEHIIDQTGEDDGAAEKQKTTQDAEGFRG